MALLSTDPVAIRLTADDDIDLTNGLVLTSGLEAVAIGIRVRLLMFRGEWFLNLRTGVPWLVNATVPAGEALLGQRFNEARARAAVSEAILRTPGVKAITTLRVTYANSTRLMSITWAVSTVFGDTDADTLEL
jgi:hypothetical protein